MNSDYQVETFKFYTRVKGETDITFNGVAVVPSGADYLDGAPPQNPPVGYDPKSFTAKSYDIESIKPELADSDPIQSSINIGSIQGENVIGLGSFTQAGIIWNPGSVEIDYFGKVGTGGYVQLAMPNRSLMRQLTSNAPQGTEVNLIKETNNGMWGLDAGFRYPYFSNWGIDNPSHFEDTPRNPLVYFHSDGYTEGLIQSIAIDKFETWLMYLPPNKIVNGVTYPTVWVPLKSFE